VEFTGKTAFVTGGANGIGLGIWRAAAPALANCVSRAS
jgi:NAD(P)-dependent dehydrogenase (short-subunit alcohol dehydrogenase family)